MPEPPAILMVKPTNPSELTDNQSFEKFMETVVDNNGLAAKARLQLNELQSWILEARKIYPK